MQKQVGEFERLGLRVLALSFAPPDRVRDYLKLSPSPFPIWSDETHAIYRAFGLESVSWLELLTPSTLWRYLRFALRGKLPEKPSEDVHQLGGDFLLDAKGQIVFAHRGKDPADRPSVATLLERARSMGR